MCLGDIVGYGPNPNECVRLLRERAKHAVLGNHDLAAIENFGVEYFNDAARAAIEWTQNGTRRRLAARGSTRCRTSCAFPDFLLVHGAPVNYFEYILDKRAAQAFERTDAPLIFVGHTHIARVLDARAGRNRSATSTCSTAASSTLNAGRRYIVDVGSVGQPRDLNPEASLRAVTIPTSARGVDALRLSDRRRCKHKIHGAHLARLSRDRVWKRDDERACRSTTETALRADRKTRSACTCISTAPTAAMRVRSHGELGARNFKGGAGSRTAASPWRCSTKRWRTRPGLRGHRGVTASVNVRFRKPVRWRHRSRSGPRDVAAP